METNKIKFWIKNKKILIFVAILLVSLFASPPIAMNHIYIGEDVLYHFLRIEELSNNILSGKFFPYIYENALGGYGYGSAFFYPEITLFVPALLYILGFKLNTALNISIFIYNVITGLIVYFTLSIFLKDEVLRSENANMSKWLSLVGSLAYIIYPYRLYNIFYRGALNEFIAMSFIPLAILSMYKIFFKREFKYWKMLSASFSLLLLTHLSTTLILGLVGIVFMIINLKLIISSDFIKSMLKAISCAILATAYFLFPMIEQMFSNEFFYTTLPKLNNIDIYPNQTIDKKVFQLLSEHASQIGLLILNIVIIFLFILIIKKFCQKIKNKKWKIFIKSVFILIYIFIMQTNIFPWKGVITILPIIQQVQFPFRFFAIGGVAFALMIITSIPELNDNSLIFKMIIIGLFIIAPSLMLSDKYLDNLSVKKEELYLVENTWCIGFGEYLPSKIEPSYEKYIKGRGNKVEVKYRDGKIKGIDRDKKESHLRYDIDNRDGEIVSIELPLTYYKGYKATANEKSIDIKQSKNGFVELHNLPKSKVYINIIYKGTVVQHISKIITIASVISGIEIYMKNGRYKYRI